MGGVPEPLCPASSARAFPHGLVLAVTFLGSTAFEQSPRLHSFARSAETKNHTLRTTQIYSLSVLEAKSESRSEQGQAP